jgi:hypothetical protein
MVKSKNALAAWSGLTLRGRKYDRSAWPGTAASTAKALIIRAVLRGVPVTTALVVLHYLLPLDRPWTPAPRCAC